MAQEKQVIAGIKPRGLVLGTSNSPPFGPLTLERSCCECTKGLHCFTGFIILEPHDHGFEGASSRFFRDQSLTFLFLRSRAQSAHFNDFPYPQIKKRASGGEIGSIRVDRIALTLCAGSALTLVVVVMIVSGCGLRLIPGNLPCRRPMCTLKVQGDVGCFGYVIVDNNQRRWAVNVFLWGASSRSAVESCGLAPAPGRSHSQSLQVEDEGENCDMNYIVTFSPAAN